MMYLRWILFAAASLTFDLLVMATAPIWAAWAAIGNLDVLPCVFAWVHTHDDDIYGSGTRQGMGDFSGKPTKFVKRFTTAVWWLWRNPGYTFDAYVLGFPSAGVTFEENDRRGEFDQAQWAYHYALMRAASGQRYFSLRRDIPISATKFIKFWVGWNPNPQVGAHKFKMALGLRTVAK